MTDRSAGPIRRLTKGIIKVLTGLRNILGVMLMSVIFIVAILTLNDNSVNTKYVKKVIEGRPNAVDAMLSKEIQLVINTAEGTNSIKDSFSLRQTALINKIPYYTTIQGAQAVALAIKSIKDKHLKIKSLQSYFE